LRYLELSGKCMKNLPGEVGGLSFLQTLDLHFCEQAGELLVIVLSLREKT
jgi:hypothetical protein